MERILKATVEILFFVAVVVAVAIDSVNYAFTRKGLVERDERQAPASLR